MGEPEFRREEIDVQNEPDLPPIIARIGENPVDEDEDVLLDPPVATMTEDIPVPLESSYNACLLYTSPSPRDS